jgi:glycogen operon protein
MTEADWFGPTVGLGMLLSGSAMSERDQHGRPLRDDSFLLLLNAGDRVLDFTLPGGPRATGYESVLDTALADQRADPATRHPALAALPLPARSLRLLRLVPTTPNGTHP